MAAVASGDGDRVGRGTGEASEQRQQENGGIPQEGTKEHMSIVERHLDQLTYSGSAVNDLELQLSRARASYHRTLSECKVHLEETRKKLGACIPKSQPFIDVWRRARQIQEESNRAAASFDKASSQYAAAKEMIKVAEEELEKMISVRAELPSESSESSSITPNDALSTTSLNHAWQEMLNHATIKVVATEQEKRASEVEHRQVLDRCTAILEEYRTVERKLRPHIVKSRPYYEERWQSSQRLAEIKSRITSLVEQLRATKKRYADTLQHLDHLNHGLHQQRRANSLTPASSFLLPPGTHRHTASEGSTPDLPHRLAADHSDSESVQSWQLGDTQFTGSTGSLPSIGSSLSDDSVDRPHPPSSENQLAQGSQPAQGSCAATPVIRVVDENSVAHVAQEVVQRSLLAAVARLQQASLQ